MFKPDETTRSKKRCYFLAGRSNPSFTQRFVILSMRFCVSGCEENILSTAEALTVYFPGTGWHYMVLSYLPHTCFVITFFQICNTKLNNFL